MVLSDNGKTSRYTCNATGERIMKSYGTMEGVYINGAPQGITFHETDNFTLYPASILSVNKNRFTKHYFIGDKRVASRIGTGLFNNVYGRNGSYVTAGQQDYAERMNQIQKQKEAYYKQQGIAPGVPTMKGAYGDPENTGVGYNAVLTELGNHDVPQGWIQTPRPNTTPNTNPGPPVSWNDPSTPDDPQAGYGYIPNDTTKEETFFYHSNHLGSTSYITDDKANITQYDAYLPYGELLVDEHSSSEDLPYKFNGKQFDEETGLYYYGARYLNPMASIWYGVDPLAEKYVTTGGYAYTLDNPVRLIDLDGRRPKLYVETHGFGHTFITVGEGKNTIVYTYGRYMGGDKGKSSSGASDPSGKGVLIRYTGKDALRYLKYELSDQGAQAYEIQDASDKKIQKYMDDVFSKGRLLTRAESVKYEKSPHEYGLPSNARVIDKYSLLSNNCTTKSVTAVQIGGTKLDFIEDRGTVPTPVYVPNPTQMKSKIYAPSDMSNYLNVLSKRPYSVVKNVTLQMNREINKLLK